MAASTRPGWEYNSDGKLEATFRQNVQPGASGGRSFKNNIVVVANTTTGGYDAYYDNRSQLGISYGRTALYSFNPDTGKITPYAANKDLFDRVYPNGVRDPQILALNKDTKNGIIENLRLNATDPIDQKNLKAIREKAGYRSEANAEAVDPNAAAAGAGTGGGTGDGTGTGTGDGTAGAESSETPAEPPIELPALEKAIGRTSYEDLRYPSDIADTQQDYLRIQMVEYSPRPLQGGIIPPRDNAIGQRTVLSTIILPIPGGIGDQNTADWSKKEMDILDQQIGNLVSGAIRGGGPGAAEAVGETSRAIQNDPGGVQNLVANKIIKELTRVDRLQREGAVINQNTELLFNGPGLRSFNFRFKFAPRGKDEAKVVQKIIRTLKQGMSPKTSNEFLYVRAPYTFFLSYQHLNQDHPYLNKFKECALTSLSVNYTPDGNYATYYDGSMVSYQVTMAFQELEPVFDSDYGDDYANIGY